MQFDSRGGGVWNRNVDGTRMAGRGWIRRGLLWFEVGAGVGGDGVGCRWTWDRRPVWRRIDDGGGGGLLRWTLTLLCFSSLNWSSCSLLRAEKFHLKVFGDDMVSVAMRGLNAAHCSSL